MKNSKTAKNATKSTTYTVEEKEPSRKESQPQEDVEAIETVDLNLITRDGDNSPNVGDERKDSSEVPFTSTAHLAVILGQLVGYFTDRADVDDMDVLSFSLHHLFCRVDYLYRKALPALQSCIEQSLANNPRSRQGIWSELQSINRTLDRMEPLCHLLSDATECILDAFDYSSANSIADAEEERHTSHPKKNLDASGEQSWFSMLDSQRWEQALAALTEGLKSWRQSYRTLVPFTTQFARLVPVPSTLARLDTAFASMLDCAGTIFGEILPGFRAIAVGDEETVAALLFDLMQQSDQLLVQFDMTLEPMNELIKQFAIEVRFSDLNQNAAVLTGI